LALNRANDVEGLNTANLSHFTRQICFLSSRPGFLQQASDRHLRQFSSQMGKTSVGKLRHAAVTPTIIRAPLKLVLGDANAMD
jgi:hypothetical protein